MCTWSALSQMQTHLVNMLARTTEIKGVGRDRAFLEFLCIKIYRCHGTQITEDFRIIFRKYLQGERIDKRLIECFSWKSFSKHFHEEKVAAPR
jgi:hypothetical protein